ncbi:hypothetical protein Tco_0852522 [Tanacetum coccineum]
MGVHKTPKTMSYRQERVDSPMRVWLWCDLRVEMVINPPWIMPFLGTKGLASPNANGFCWTAEVVPKSVASSCFLAASSTLLPLMFKFNKTFDVRFQGYEDQSVCHKICSIQDSSRLDVAVKFIFQSSWYVVPTGRVVVPTGRYVVPTGKVIFIVSPGRLNLVPTGRILSPGKVK